MIKPGATIFFRDPKIEKERVLVPSTLQAVEDEMLVAQLVPTERFETGQEVTVFYELKREFMQQPVQIDRLEPGEEGPLVRYFALGDPVSAESRQHYRVTTISAELLATVGPDTGCPVQDVSATGFAAVVPTRYAQGERVAVSIEHGELRCEGEAVVQSITERADGFRYGFLSAGSGELQEQLNQVSLAVQREQLQRLSGAGGA